MAAQETVDQFVIRQIKTQLAGVAAAAPDWTPADQTRFLRALAEQGVDKLEAAEREYFDYMEQCILLAGENMQDARLQILEARMDEQENPPVNLADTLLQASLMLVAELVIAHGAWVAIPVLYGLARCRGYRRVLAKVKFSQFNRGIDADISRARSGLDDLLKQRRNIKSTIRKIDRISGNQDLAIKELAKLAVIDRKLIAEQRFLQALEAARAKSDRVAEEVAEAMAKQADVDDVRMKKMLEGITASVATARVGEALGEDFASTAIDVASQSSEPPVAFQTSDLLSDYLAALQADRRISSDSWAAMRFHIRFVPDEDFWGSAIVQNVLARAIEADYWSVEPSNFTGTERRFFILGFESMLWLHWFVFNGLIATSPFTDEIWHHTPPVLAMGNALEGRLITERRDEVTTDPFGLEIWTFFFSGTMYPGAPRLSDEQTEYLYQKFVRRYFLASPEAAPAGITFDVERYDLAWKMAKTGWVLPSYDRKARVEEIKILIIEYFRREYERVQQEGSSSGAGGASGQKVRDTIREMLGLEPGHQPLDELFDQLPERPHDPGPPLLSQTAAEEATLLAGELAGADGRDQTWLVSDTQSLLESAIADLDLQIIGFDDNGPTADDDPLRSVERFKDRLRRRYAEYLEAADNDPEQRAAVQDEHGARITRLLDWEPPREAYAAQWQLLDDNTTT